MVIMTSVLYLGKFLPLEKIRPYLFNKFPEKYAKLIFNTFIAVFVAASILYLIIVIILIFKLPTEMLWPFVLVFFIRDLIRVVKDKK